MAGSDPSTAAVRDLATAYLQVLFLAAPFDLLGVAAMTSQQAGGDTRTPMRISILAGSLNLVLTRVLRRRDGAVSLRRPDGPQTPSQEPCGGPATPAAPWWSPWWARSWCA